MQRVLPEIDEIFRGADVEADQPGRDERDRIAGLQTGRWLARLWGWCFVQRRVDVRDREGAKEPGKGARLGVEHGAEPRA